MKYDFMNKGQFECESVGVLVYTGITDFGHFHSSEKETYTMMLIYQT